MTAYKILITILIITLYRNLIAHPQELPLLISVCAYNAAPWVEKNLDSIYSQQYHNFHVVYVDDASEDDTALKVQRYIDTHYLQDKITLIVNETRQRKMKNIYNVFHNCPDNTIIVQVDGDDWLAHDHVFIHINKVYQENNIWLTYGQFQIYPGNNLGYCQAVPDEIKEKRTYREYKWVYTHLRTFYAWLFKSIKLQDFIAEEVPGYNGKFFPVTNDNASYFPMLEMCGNNFQFIPDILYIHNHGNPNYGRVIELDLYKHARKDIRSRQKYPTHQEPTLNRMSGFENAQAEIMILSLNNPAGLKRLLKSMYDYAQALESVTVIFEASSPEITDDYQAVHDSHPHTKFVSTKNKSARSIISSVLENSSQNHIMLARDTIYLINHFNITECILELERTFAYGFYFSFAHNKTPFYYESTQKENIPHQLVQHNIYAWKFNCGRYALYNNIDMTLLRKSDLVARINMVPQTSERSLASFLASWHSNKAIDGQMVGLFLAEAKLGGKRTSIFIPAQEKLISLTNKLQNLNIKHLWLFDDLTQELMDFF